MGHRPAWPSMASVFARKQDDMRSSGEVIPWLDHSISELKKAIPHCEKIEDYEALLPWDIDLVKVTAKDQQLTLFDNLTFDAHS